MSLVTDAVNELRDKVQAVREAHSPFIKAMTDAMTGYRQMRADGVPKADCVRGLETTLREAMSETNPRLWRVDCQACDDTGWQSHACPERPCQRVQAHGQHTYVTVCPCRAMNRTYQRHHGKSEDEMESKLAAAASTKGRR